MLGSVIITVKEPDGETYLILSSNLVVDATRLRIVDSVLNGTALNPIDEIQLGLAVGIDPAGNDDIAMQSVDPTSLSIDAQTVENNGLTIKSVSETVTVSGETFSFNELGLLQSGALFSRVVFDTNQSIPIGSQYTVEWKITF
jgi:hypothetical protein